jgi:hypothetical protein
MIRFQKQQYTNWSEIACKAWAKHIQTNSETKAATKLDAKAAEAPDSGSKPEKQTAAMKPRTGKLGKRGVIAGYTSVKHFVFTLWLKNPKAFDPVAAHEAAINAMVHSGAKRANAENAVELSTIKSWRSGWQRYDASASEKPFCGVDGFPRSNDKHPHDAKMIAAAIKAANS